MNTKKDQSLFQQRIQAGVAQPARAPSNCRGPILMPETLNFIVFFPLASIILNRILIEMWLKHTSKMTYTFNFTRPPPVKPLSRQTALPQRLYSVLKPCQRAVGSPRNTTKNIKFASYSVYTTSSQRPYSVHTTFPQRLYSVHNVFTACKQLLQRIHGAHTARSRRAHGTHTTFSRRAHSVLKAIIAFKIFYFFIFILSNPILQTQCLFFTFRSNQSQNLTVVKMFKVTQDLHLMQ